MSRRRLTPVIAAVATAALGCAPASTPEPASRAEVPKSPPAGQQAPNPDAGPIAGPIAEVSPAGVTTAVNAPAESTEEQYAKACVAAKDWMTARGGDPQMLVEPFLSEVQNSDAVGPATFQSSWARLTDPQRSAVIVAVRAAADGGC